MNQVARVFVVINLLLAAGFLMAAATFLQQNKKYKEQYTAETERAADAETKKQGEIDVLEKQLKQVREDYSRANDKVASLEAVKSNLDTELTAAHDAKGKAESNEKVQQGAFNTLTNAHGQLSGQFDKIEETIDRYRARAEEDRKNLEEALAAKLDAELDRDTKAKTIHTRDLTIEQLNNQLSDTKTRLLAYQGAYPPPERLTQPKVDGQVTRYDRGTNLVMVNRGSTQGVKIGHKFDVVRGSQFIGTVIIDRVEQTSSIGHVEVKTSRIPQAGDRATTL